ncbi:hypothetical protein RRG08_042141 [Elysia crispata]|uniref:Uncharacterized protein n=1 Tax=Elysia crispata TaxID=231223 RepID=A0AAE1A2D1_9GAST|nr:hypothetical protein RRG08_042141 [Elysia crispata]
MLLSQLKETTSHGLRWNKALTLLSTFIYDWFTGSKCCVWLQGILIMFGIFQNVRLKQVNDSRCFGMSIYNVVTAQQFTEPLDRMLNPPDTSQGTLRTLWPMMLSEL